MVMRISSQRWAGLLVVLILIGLPVSARADQKATRIGVGGFLGYVAARVLHVNPVIGVLGGAYLGYRTAPDRHEGQWRYGRRDGDWDDRHDRRDDRDWREQYNRYPTPNYGYAYSAPSVAPTYDYRAGAQSYPAPVDRSIPGHAYE